MNIAVIPARGGSKRIPRKNIKLFNNKPIISFAIEAAEKSELFDRIIVSTNDNEIKKISEIYGAEVPFMRPEKLANDYTDTHSVILHAIEMFNKLNYEFNNICTIYPCVPLIQINDIKKVFELLKINLDNYCFPVTEFESPIERALTLDKKSKIKPIENINQSIRTQDFNKIYHDCGMFYWASKETWLLKKEIAKNGVGYPIPSWRSIDIDNNDDWMKAEILFHGLKNKCFIS